MNICSMLFMIIFIISLTACTGPVKTEVESPTSLPTNVNEGPTFPPVTARDVPAPAPVPWPDIQTYTEQTYEIKVKAGEEFAIGMFATGPINYSERHDGDFIERLGNEMIQYQPSVLNKYGTEWFLYKAIKTGSTEIVFQTLIEYTKIFKVIIH